MTFYEVCRDIRIRLESINIIIQINNIFYMIKVALEEVAL